MLFGVNHQEKIKKKSSKSQIDDDMKTSFSFFEIFSRRISNISLDETNFCRQHFTLDGIAFFDPSRIFAHDSCLNPDHL